MKISREAQFLKIIKFTPAIITFLVSLFGITFLYFENKKIFLEEKKALEEQFIQENKMIIKDEVERVYDFILYLQKTTEQELKNSVKMRVYEAHTLATNIYEKNKDTKSNEEIFQLIKMALSGIRYNEGRGYFFMDDVHGNKLIHPVDTSIEGKNFLDFTDVNGYKFFQAIVNTIKDKTERFDEYYWYKPNTDKEISRKISFYKYFEPLNMAIGTGEYVDEFEKEIKRKALEYIKLIRFGKTGYIFVLDYHGTYLSHIREDYIGRNYVENNDTEDVLKVVRDTIEISKNGSGYYSYIQNKKPGTEESIKKYSFVKGLNNWNWMIGTGFYEDDINLKVLEHKKRLDEKYNSYIQNIIILSIVLIVILLVVSKYVSNFIEDKFNQYKSEINKKQTILHQQSKMAAMGEMIGNIAHQWRQPLSTITTASSGMVLQKEMGILTDEFFFEASKKINNSAQYLSQTIDDFRNFFTPNKEKYNFNLADTFSTTLELISAQFIAREIIIIKNIEDIELHSYENELIQGLINILNNAKDELIKKPLEEKKYIFIDVYKYGNDVNILIKDNAGGIPSEYIDKIFEPYFTTKHKSQGTGIGLYMTEEIITKHLEGQILVENKEFTYEDKEYIGAQFTIVLNLLSE